MDQQLNLIWSMNKQNNRIVYPHESEIVIIEKVADNNGSFTIYEIRIDNATGKQQKRELLDIEMTCKQFDDMKELLDENTNTWFRNEKNQTYKNVCFDSLEGTSLICVPSPETEMIEREEQLDADRMKANNPLRRTMENAESIMNACLSETQKRRFKMHYFEGKTTREIALQESIAQRSVMDSLDYANKKIEKYFKKHKKTPLKTPLKSI